MTSGGKSAVLTKFGGPDSIEIQNLPIPVPADDEVRIRVISSGVAYADIKIRHGLYKTAPKPPMVPGYDCLGIIDSVGRKVTKFKKGDRCLALTMVGSNAEYITQKTDYIALAPQKLDPIAGGAIPLNYVTAYQMLVRLAKVSEGDTILIHGGAGGVGTALLDLTKDMGLTVYATASAAKHDQIRSYGAIPIDYNKESFVEILQKAGGADAVFDHLAGENYKRSAKAAKTNGRVIGFGYMAMVRGEKHVVGKTLWEIIRLKLFTRKKPHFYAILTPMAGQMKHIAKDLEHLATRVASGDLKPVIGKVLSLEDIVEAHELMEHSQVTGKVVITVNAK